MYLLPAKLAKQIGDFGYSRPTWVYLALHEARKIFLIILLLSEMWERLVPRAREKAQKLFRVCFCGERP